VEKDSFKFIMEELGDPTLFEMNLKKILTILELIMKKWEELSTEVIQNLFRLNISMMWPKK
jgi:hypothetical protein